MKNYEIVLMFSVGEDSLTDQTVEKYKLVITENGGSIDRHEDWGPLKMAYDINNENKARSRFNKANVPLRTSTDDDYIGIVELFSNIKKGVLKPHITEYEFKDVAKAHKDLESGQSKGSLVLKL